MGKKAWKYEPGGSEAQDSVVVGQALLFDFGTTVDMDILNESNDSAIDRRGHMRELYKCLDVGGERDERCKGGL